MKFPNGRLPLVALLAAGLAAPLPAALAVRSGVFELAANLASDTVDIEVTEEGEASRILDDSANERRVTVTNKGAACWIRFRRTARRGEGEAVPACAPAEVRFKAAADGYVYCLDPLEEGGRLSWVEEVGVPEELRDGLDTDLVSEVTVEAVQTRGLPVDFDSDDPWAGTEPRECVHAREEERP